MSASFLFTLRSPINTPFEGEVDSVKLKTDLGRMEILPGHATLIGTILYSRVFVRTGATEQEYVIRQGSVTVDETGHVRLLAQDIQEAGNITIESLEQYLVYISKQLDNGHTLNEYQRTFLQEQRDAIEESMKSE